MDDATRLGFEIKGYPGTARRIEMEADLSQVYRPDLVQGAFMGDAIMQIGDVNFSTKFGWVTLIDWCLRLSVSTANLEVVEARHFQFAESDDFMSFRRHDEEVFVASSYVPGIACARYATFTAAVRDFVDGRLRWLTQEFPAAMRNPAMGDVFARLGRAFPQPPSPEAPPATRP